MKRHCSTYCKKRTQCTVPESEVDANKQCVDYLAAFYKILKWNRQVKNVTVRNFARWNKTAYSKSKFIVLKLSDLAYKKQAVGCRDCL